MMIKFGTVLSLIAVSIYAQDAEASAIRTWPFTTSPVYGRFVDCEGGGTQYSCDEFSSGTMADYKYLFTRGTISYYSHYLDGKHNWFAVLKTKLRDGSECIMYDMSCNCGAQLDRWFQIPSGYTGTLIPGGRSSDYVVAWRNDGQHSQDWNDFSQIKLSC